MRIILSCILLLSVFTCRGQSADIPQLQALKEAIADRTYPNIDGVIVEHCDARIVEEYFNGFDKESRHDMRSSFKSVTSLLTGIAVDKGLMTIHDPLSQYFPELAGSDKGKITIQNLLEMRSGFNCEEFYDIGPYCEGAMTNTDDWVAYCLNVKTKHQAGLNWSYNSNDPMVMGEVIARASDMSVMDFAKENLFGPLGIMDYEWTLSPKGRGMTAGSFYIRPMDMLKLTRLVYNKGKWNGRQVVSEEWIAQSTNCEIPIDFSFTRYSRMPNAQYQSARYGFYWYRERITYQEIDTEVLFASGNGGNYMMILPDYQTKVVFTGSNYGNWRGKLPFEILLKYIIPMVADRDCR